MRGSFPHCCSSGAGRMQHLARRAAEGSPAGKSRGREFRGRESCGKTPRGSLPRRKPPEKLSKRLPCRVWREEWSSRRPDSARSTGRRHEATNRRFMGIAGLWEKKASEGKPQEEKTQLGTLLIRNAPCHAQKHGSDQKTARIPKPPQAAAVLPCRQVWGKGAAPPSLEFTRTGEIRRCR